MLSNFCLENAEGGINYCALNVSAVPSSPQGPIQVTEVNKTSARISWQPSEQDGGSPITKYIVEMKEGWKSTWTKVTEVSSDMSLTFVLSKMKESSEYTVQVTAVNKVGSSKPLVSDQPIKPKNPYSK